MFQKNQCSMAADHKKTSSKKIPITSYIKVGLKL